MNPTFVSILKWHHMIVSDIIPSLLDYITAQCLFIGLS